MAELVDEKNIQMVDKKFKRTQFKRFLKHLMTFKLKPAPIDRTFLSLVAPSKTWQDSTLYRLLLPQPNNAFSSKEAHVLAWDTQIKQRQ